MSKSAIDFSVIQSYLGPEDDLSLIANLAEYFKTNAPERLQSAKNSYMSGDNKQTKHYLHALKNSFLNIGALEAAEQCQVFENRIESVTYEEVDEWVDQLQTYISTAQTEIADFIKKMSSRN
jgi:HPt (histidine-containing phosphotransfer) domain-containing protein